MKKVSPEITNGGQPLNDQALRVLVVATTFPRWKDDREPRFVFEQVKRIVKKVNLWVLLPHAPQAAQYETMENVKVLRFPYFFPKSLQSLCYDGGILPNLKNSVLARLQLPFFLVAQFFYIWKTIRKYKINLIHCHWIIPQGFFVALLRSIYKIPYILTAHGGDVFSFKGNKWVDFLRKFSLKKASICTVNSRATLDAVERFHPATPVTTIPMGVDTDLFNPNKCDATLKEKLNIKGHFLLAVGRFAEKKGFKFLIKAMPQILEKQPEAKLAIVGFGPQEKELKDLVSKLNLWDSIIMPGSKTDIELAKYFATADLFIGPSIVTASGDTEGQGVVFLEAMASKTPVIATDVGGISDIVLDGSTGLLIPQKNSEAIAEKTLYLLDNPNLKTKLISNARKRVEEKYSWERIAETFLDVYRKTAGNFSQY